MVARMTRVSRVVPFWTVSGSNMRGTKASATARTPMPPVNTPDVGVQRRTRSPGRGRASMEDVTGPLPGSLAGRPPHGARPGAVQEELQPGHDQDCDEQDQEPEERDRELVGELPAGGGDRSRVAAEGADVGREGDEQQVLDHHREPEGGEQRRQD